MDEQASDIDDALARIEKYTQAGEAKSIALLGNAAEILPELVKRGVKPDCVTDQTSAHDPVHGYLPIGWTVEQWSVSYTHLDVYKRQASQPASIWQMMAGIRG